MYTESNPPPCFGRLYSSFEVECNTACIMSVRCGAAYHKNIQKNILEDDGHLIRVPVIHTEGTAGGCAREVILEMTEAEPLRQFRASDFHAPYYAKCRMSGIEPGNAVRTVRKALMNLRKEGKIKSAGISKWTKP